MVNLRAEARDRDCQIRLDCCNGNRETTVLAHFRLSGISGMGFKSPDFIGAWACSACHQRVDTDKSVEVQLDFAKAVFRTQAQLLREGSLHL
jgi:hypothetical protein